jgi:hypothetical protein
MKPYYIIFICFVICINNSRAQLAAGKYTDYFREGVYLMCEENYDYAIKNFLEAYKIDSTSANINFNIGFSYLNSSKNKSLAEKYLAKSISNITKKYQFDNVNEKAAPPLAFLYYGKALHINYKFTEAMVQYDYFEKNYAKDKTNKEELAFYESHTNVAKELLEVPMALKIDNLGDSINTSFSEYSPVLSNDEKTLIYTKRTNTGIFGQVLEEGQYSESIVFSKKTASGLWSAPKSISQNINTTGHEASIFLTSDDQTLIIFKGISEKDGNIYFSNWDGNDWTSLQDFGSDINSKYWESHACLNSDKTILYFVSDRPGGYGGRDIYRCTKLPNGLWGKSINVGPTINTKYDEDGPFIHPDGNTLLFASMGHKSMGGFDIFVSTIEDNNKFSEPQNIGYPINTTDDDVFFVTTANGKRGYFSSAKAGGFGEKDLYSITLSDDSQKPMVLVKGSILFGENGKLMDDVLIVVTDKATGEIVGSYKPKSNGSFASILSPNNNYSFSYLVNNDEFYKEDLFVSNDLTYQQIQKEVNLKPVNLIDNVANHNDKSTKKTIEGCGTTFNYKHSFAYNKNEIDREKEWELMIEVIVEKTKECNAIVKVMSSASQVPTRAFSSNKELAKSRANKMVIKIKEAVSAKGGDANKIKFVKLSAVKGPVYAADYKNDKKYGPFQYVKVMTR